MKKDFSFKEMRVYKKAFGLSMEIFKVSKRFPEIEKYSLTSQIRRSSRSVCANIAEGYRKRRYPAHFISKATDADMENSETQVWLDFTLACEYISANEFSNLEEQSKEIGRLLQHMQDHPDKYGAIPQ